MKREVAAEIVDSLKEAGVDFVAVADTVGYQFGLDGLAGLLA